MPDLTLPQQIARMDGERLRTYRGNLDFYNGLQWPGSPRSRERRLTFNYVKPFVQKLTSYLVDGLSLHIEPWADSESARTIAQRAQEALRGVHQDNHLEQLDFDTELDAAVLGDGAYKVIWDPQEHRVRVSSPDVQGLFAWHIADDPTQVWRVASRYSLSPEEAQLLYGEGVSKLFSNKKQVIVVEAWTDRSFQIWLDDAPLRERPNPYGFIPFVLFPNLREPK
ncbi:MAG: portal protein, partial [Chloroflexi bacterium]|nr:portal protein [Chloroflexota bacterium]